jgi:hypothetical protein
VLSVVNSEQPTLSDGINSCVQLLELNFQREMQAAEYRSMILCVRF